MERLETPAIFIPKQTILRMAFGHIDHIEDVGCWRKHEKKVQTKWFTFLFTDRLLAHSTFDFDHYVTNIKSNINLNDIIIYY